MQFHTDEFRQSRDVRIQVTKSTCGRAKWAVRLALLPVVPLMPLLAMGTAASAMKRIKNDASLTGAGRAQLAMTLGLLFSGVQAFLGWQVWRYVEAARSGPQVIIAQGQQGDVNAFLANFDDAANRVNPALAAVFLDVVNDRYGSCGETSLELTEKWYMSWRPFEPFEYAARFDDAIVPITAQFVTTPEFTTWDWRPKLRYIEIHDAKHGNVRFPPDEQSIRQLASHTEHND